MCALGHLPPGEGFGALNYNLSFRLGVDKCGSLGLYCQLYWKSCEEESTLWEAGQRALQGESGHGQNMAEDGLGAGMSIGRLPRVRPLKRFEAKFGGDCHTSLRTGSQ